MRNPQQLVITAGVMVFAVFALFLAHLRPEYFNDAMLLAGVIFMQLLIAAVWKFRSLFFAFLMMAFLWAGLDLPMTEAWTSARWVVLAAGAVAGYVLFMHDRRWHFHSFHLVALFSVAAAFVSALVSTYPRTAVLKALSLLLLFVYAGSGGRLAILGRESSFFRGLLVACEVITVLSAIAYFPLNPEPWGNPNSLGLVMGVGIAPLLFWGTLIAETRSLRWRRAAAFYVSLMLLFLSVARASIIGGISAIVISCIVLRRQKLLLQTAMIALFALTIAALLAPEKLSNLAASASSEFLYKGHRDTGVLGSRRSPWQETFEVIGQHPWFGGGFGTSPSGQEQNGEGMFASNTDTSREHGSSYLAILEWEGLLGVVPFAALLLMLFWKAGQVLAWMSRTRCVDHPAVPIVMVIIATFIHAAFEDWLFAPGYYFTVFFWTLAFVFFDLAPGRAGAALMAPELFNPAAFASTAVVPSQQQA
jgi:O-antigen ligase